MIIHGATYFDSKSLEFICNKELWIEDGKILDIGTGFDRSGHEVYDLTNFLILPGWIDAHVHLTLSGSANPILDWQQNGAVYAGIRAAGEYLSNYLKAGVTVVRDLGGADDVVLALKKAQKVGIIVGPEILTAGRPLTMTGGHLWQISKEVDGIDEAMKAVRQELKKGVDLIKVIATGGILTSGTEPGAPQLTEAEINAIVEEAHHAKKLVSVHAEGQQGILNSLRSGVDTLEHGIGLDQEGLELMKARSVTLVPTIMAPRLILQHKDELPLEMVKKAEKLVSEHQESFAFAYQNGIRIAVGTDAGTPFNLHGAYQAELKELLKEGMKIEEILQAASLNGAIALGIDREYGNIEPGMYANLTIIDDSLQHKEWYYKVRMIMHKGSIFKIL